MEFYNVDCPRGYGKITFIKVGDVSPCPLSGKLNCVECGVTLQNLRQVA